MRGASRVSVIACTIAVVSACKGGPTVPSPLTGETRYLCCNMHYEKTEITDVNYLRGSLIPFGTRVQILEVRRNAVKFQPAGHPAITLVQRQGRKFLGMEEYLDRIFLRDDPRAKLPRAGKGGRQAVDAEKVRKQIEQGVVEPGMTKEQVVMAIGYPPPHRTPSLQAATWTYWANRWETFDVYFDGDRVARVSR